MPRGGSAGGLSVTAGRVGCTGGAVGFHTAVPRFRRLNGEERMNPNTAQYPGSIVTDTQMPPMTDRASSTLSAPIDDSTLTIPVVSTALFTNFPMILTVDMDGTREQILVTGKTGNNLTASVRGYGPSAASAHPASVSVRANLTAHHLNQLYAEIKAIQTVLGANLSEFHRNFGHNRVFTYTGSTQTYTVPAYVNVIELTAVGGGGGGEGGIVNNGGGGGGAGQVVRIMLAVTPGETLTINLGAGGAGGSSTLPGSNGSSTIITRGAQTLVVAAGGQGGSSSKGGNSGSGATGSNGGAPPTRPSEQFARSGAASGGWTGTFSLVASVRGSGEHQQTPDTPTVNTSPGGHGGGTPHGIPGKPNTAAGNGQAGTFGAGGAGASQSAAAGGAGGNGYCIILT